jgi:predicted N-acetyltransferase YhbS
VTELRYDTLRPEHAAACADLELRAFPTADPAELLSEADILAYADVFPEGFFVALDGDRVVGQGAGILVDFDFGNPEHTADGITGEHHCGNHDPDGDWYYGTDIAVDPDHRRRGIGGELYRLRKQLVVDLGRRGIIAGGYLAGFGDHKHEMTAAEYCDRVAAGELYDRTLTFQLENGFVLRGVLEGYLTDEQNDGWAALIVWENPEAPTP